MRAWALSVLLSLASFGCARSFDVRTASGFIELEHQKLLGYDYRATTPDGVVVGVRSIADEKRGDLSFWSNAILLQLRDSAGYASLGIDDVVALGGEKGKRLRFGRDQDSKPYLYEVSVFLANDRLFLLEAGGSKDAITRVRPQIDAMEKSFAVR